MTPVVLSVHWEDNFATQPRVAPLYYYPRAQRLTPTLYDPELEQCVRRGLAEARAVLARRGSAAILRCVLFEVAHGEVFWLGEESLSARVKNKR